MAALHVNSPGPRPAFRTINLFWCALYLHFLLTAIGVEADVPTVDFSESKCTFCHSCYCVESGGRSGITLLGIARSRSTDLRLQSTPPKRSGHKCRSIGQQCRPCTVCPSGHSTLRNCTATKDTVCSHCPEGQRWNRVRRSCKEMVQIIHQVHVIKGPAPTTTIPVEQHSPTHGSNLARHSNNEQGVKEDPDLTEEANSEEGSPGYISSLFICGAAGVSLIVLVILIVIYVTLRFLRFWKWKRSRPPNGSSTSRQSAHTINIRTNPNVSEWTPQNTSYRNINAKESTLNAPSPERKAGGSAVTETATGNDDHQAQSESITESKSTEDAQISSESRERRIDSEDPEILATGKNAPFVCSSLDLRRGDEWEVIRLKCLTV